MSKSDKILMFLIFAILLLVGIHNAQRVWEDFVFAVKQEQKR